MELLQLRYFITVARFGSISKAAEYYGIPQPSMSQTVHRLENELGTPLFDRQYRKILLNESGRHFLEKAEAALSLLDTAKEELQSDFEKPCGEIRLLVRENRRFIFECVSRFSKKYPDISFTIVHDSNSAPEVVYDLCILSSPSYQHMQEAKLLIRERIVLAVREDNPLAQNETVSLASLRNEKFITMSDRSSVHSITYNSCRVCGFEPNVPFICDDPYFVRKYIAEDMGIALCPSIAWKDRFRQNTKLISITDPPITTDTYLIRNGQKKTAYAVRLFWNYLIEEAGKIEGNLAVKP